MTRKRSSCEADLHPLRIRRPDAKRNKITVPTGLREHSSCSETSVSSTPFSDQTASDEAQESSVCSSTSTRTADNSRSDSSLDHDDDDSDSNDSISDGSSTLGDEADAEYDEQSEQDATIVSLPLPRHHMAVPERPDIDPDLVMAYAKELQDRLHAFLPQLRKANSALAQQGAMLNMETVDDGESHIEMNLGLGVLEQKQAEAVGNDESIQLPRRNAAAMEHDTLPASGSVAGLLRGYGDQARASIEVLPQRTKPENMSSAASIPTAC